MTTKSSKSPKAKMAAIVTKSWKDEAFKKQFLANPRKVLQKEAGFEIPEGVTPEILEETSKKLFFVLPPKPAKEIGKKGLDDIEKIKKMKKPGLQHYYTVLALRSWMDEGFRKNLISDTRSAIQKEFGVQMPKDVSLEVVESDPKKFYFVLPAKPSDELDDSELESVAGGISAGDVGDWIDGAYLSFRQWAVGVFNAVTAW